MRTLACERRYATNPATIIASPAPGNNASSGPVEAMWLGPVVGTDEPEVFEDVAVFECEEF